MNWTKEFPGESGWYYVREDRHGWQLYLVDVLTKVVWYGNDSWNFEDFKEFDVEFGDKIPEPE